ncbi:MAG TPA: RHS repeat-associated core domain-containing protein [Pyrinomonadaceae bacterium]|nr:RHS repeat-associated core domain-containing protein [Pyrinomonadaceae bacterium]
MTEDALGSVRVTTNSFGEVKARRDFLPFGEELFAGLAGRNANQKYSASADDTRKKFATYQRDAETGLDYAQSRYYSPVNGRFTSPDEFKGGPDELFDFEEDASDNPTFYADLENPQSLNKYQYTYNNPYKYNDPDGHCPIGVCVWGPPVVRSGDRLVNGVLRVVQATGVTAAVAAAATAVDSHVRRRGGVDPDLTAAGRYARAVESGQPQAWQISRRRSEPSNAPNTQSGSKARASASGSVGRGRNRGVTPGSRPGKNFTKRGKDIVKSNNAKRNGGRNRCEGCKVRTTEPKKIPKGGTRPKTETNVDHIESKKNGGSGTPENGQILCFGCNVKKGSNE